MNISLRPSAGAPTVSAVIPTTLRPEVIAAIDSIRVQQYSGEIEVIVAIDEVKSEATHARVLKAADVVVYTNGRGAPAARNAGTEAASGEFIAYLDDDDSWHPEKTVRQVELAGERTVVGSRVRQIDQLGRLVAGSVPSELIVPGQQVADYLFRRRPARTTRPSFFTSTLLVGAALAREIRWNEGLARHQDWDFLVRAQHSGAVLVHSPEELATILVGSSASISARSHWEPSLRWALETIDERNVRADFLAAQTLRYALQARDSRGVIAVLSAMVATGRLPHVESLAVGMAGLAGRAGVERLMRWAK